MANDHSLGFLLFCQGRRSSQLQLSRMSPRMGGSNSWVFPIFSFSIWKFFMVNTWLLLYHCLLDMWRPGKGGSTSHLLLIFKSVEYNGATSHLIQILCNSQRSWRLGWVQSQDGIWIYFLKGEGRIFCELEEEWRELLKRPARQNGKGLKDHAWASFLPPYLPFSNRSSLS